MGPLSGMRSSLRAFAAACALAAAAPGAASAAVLFEQMSPDPTAYIHGPDFALASFGPARFDVTGRLVPVLDAGGGLSLGCSALAPVATGAILVIGRGDCSFSDKAVNAQLAGAAGVLFVNSLGTAPIAPNAEFAYDYRIPLFHLSRSLGRDLVAEAKAGDVTVRLAATVVPEPAIWALIITGFALTGAVLRRRRLDIA
jgi:hypothetical protein